MAKIWQKMKKIDFSFFALNFRKKTKNEKIAKNENFRFSLETILDNIMVCVPVVSTIYYIGRYYILYEFILIYKL